MKNKWINYFPYKEPRKIQIKAIDFILDSFFNKKKKYAICELPVGSGKSAIAITIAKYFEEKYYVETMKTSWIITTQRILQKQYQKDFSWMPTIWSKNHYECPGKTGISCQFGTLINEIFKGKYCDCIYKKDKKIFLEEDISLTNIPFLLNHIEYTQEIDKRKILIVDEAHNLESAITDFVSLTFNKYDIQEYDIEWVGEVTHINQVMFWMQEILLKKLEEIKINLNSRIKEFNKDEILNDSTGKKLVRQYKDVDKIINQIDRCISRFNENEWVLSVNKEKDEISLKPIFASKFSQRQLFCKGEKILLMSGTILNKEIFCRNIGIPIEQTEFMSLDSPFKKENRMIYAAAIGSLNYSNIDKSLPKISRAIQHIIDEHKDVKGVIHCNSFKISNYINRNVKHKNRFITHDSSNRIEMYELHLRSTNPTILVSPSLTEGIDLYDDLSRFQIIVKVPFPYLGDNFITTKMKRVTGWYEWETIKTIIQASGRSVRNEKDSAMTYILDQDFVYFYKKNSHLFPKWYKDSLVFI